MTDIETLVEAPGRKELVKKVRKKIDELGINYIYLPVRLGDRPHRRQGHSGRPLGSDRREGLPAGLWRRPRTCSSTGTATIIGYGPEASELVGIPDPETFVQLPWDKRVARVFCTCFRNREESVDPGGHPDLGLPRQPPPHPRGVPEGRTGLHLRHGIEPEMMWLKKDEDGQPDGGYRKPYCYHIDQFESLRPVFMRVIEYCRAMGLDMIQGDHEDAPGPARVEFHLRRRAAHRGPADDLPADLRAGGARVRPHRLLHVQAVHGRLGQWLPPQHLAVARRRGRGEAARQRRSNLPGMEQAFTYRRGGENTFMPRYRRHAKRRARSVSSASAAWSTISAALTAIGCSTVNSYRRLWDTGFWAPVYADWGYPEPHLRACASRRPAASSIAPSMPW